MDDNKLPSNSSDIDDSGEGDLNTVTMVDVLKAEETMEENAEAVLGPGDDRNCTFSEGYMKRQALYSCLTCLPSTGSKCAGVCLACSYHCHGDHDLVELYTKRNFRCDCGNKMFNGKLCNLDPTKTGVNEDNAYNQNFRGLYCSCSRPYPDPEDSVDDAMLQCVVCEDWFHSRHLGSSVPSEDDYCEMICAPCTDKLPFLQYYLGYAVTKVLRNDDDSAVDISVNEENISLSSPKKENKNTSTVLEISKQDDAENQENKPHVEPSESEKVKNQSTNENISDDAKESNHDIKSAEENKNETSNTNKEAENENINNPKTLSPKKALNDCGHGDKVKECLLKNLKLVPRGSGATYWPDGFRKLLCTCTSCMEMYKSKNVSFLTDEIDTILAYEEEGKSRKQQVAGTQNERMIEALSSLGRVQQMEAILNYNELKTHLSEYLAKFAQNKKVVREEDIREFFSGMESRKRQKLNIPYNCR